MKVEKKEGDFSRVFYGACLYQDLAFRLLTLRTVRV